MPLGYFLASFRYFAKKSIFHPLKQNDALKESESES